MFPICSCLVVALNVGCYLNTNDCYLYTNDCYPFNRTALPTNCSLLPKQKNKINKNLLSLWSKVLWPGDSDVPVITRKKDVSMKEFLWVFLQRFILSSEERVDAAKSWQKKLILFLSCVDKINIIFLSW